MNLIGFYDSLDQEDVDTIDIEGVLLCFENKRKWHVAKKGGLHVKGLCGSTSPSNPNGRDYQERNFLSQAETMTPQQFLEQNRLCSNCERMIKDEYDLRRVTVAVPNMGDDDCRWQDAIERFTQRAGEEMDAESIK